ncbi:MAG: hypothetical protein ACLGIB_07830 [Actinomycetota bacterium]
MAHRVEFHCAECGGWAATVELIAPSQEPSGPMDLGWDHWKIRTDGPVQVTHWVLRDLEALQLALRQGTVAALLNVDPNYVNFWCPQCTAAYCKQHWYPIDPVMDEGFYDATYGHCPHGHRVMLDD